MAAKTKNKRKGKTRNMNVRIALRDRDRFHAAARVRGSVAATQVHQFMVRYAFETEKEMPEHFASALQTVIAERLLEESEEIMNATDLPEGYDETDKIRPIGPKGEG